MSPNVKLYAMRSSSLLGNEKDARARWYVMWEESRVPAHRIRNAPAVLLDGCYAFIALIVLFLGLFYQGTLTEYLSRNPLTNSEVKLIKMDGLMEPLV